MEIERLLKIKAENEIEKLVMIFSNKCDYGGMISVKQFYALAADIMLWHEQEIKKLQAADDEKENYTDHFLDWRDKYFKIDLKIGYRSKKTNTRFELKEVYNKYQKAYLESPFLTK